MNKEIEVKKQLDYILEKAVDKKYQWFNFDWVLKMDSLKTWSKAQREGIENIYKMFKEKEK